MPLFEAVASSLRCEIIATTCVQQIHVNVAFWQRRNRKRSATLEAEHKSDLKDAKVRLSSTNLLAQNDPEASN
jgi:hypothetical protein